MNNPLIETQRLVLRRFTLADSDDLYEYLSDAQTVEYEPYEPLTADEVVSELQWRISTDEMIAVELKDANKLIGNLYFAKRSYISFEMGFVFNRAFWGMGYARESSAALMKLAFSRGVHRIFAQCDPENERSWRLLEALGFRREAEMKKNVFFRRGADGQPEWKDTFVYAKLFDE